MKKLPIIHKIVAITAIVSATILPFYVTIMAISAGSSTYGCLLAFLVMTLFSCGMICLIISSFKDMK